MSGGVLFDYTRPRLEGATTASAYDLLSDEDREALAWAREHGGLAEVEKRLMPDGMEWPRFEDGEPVMLGDSVTKYVGGEEFKVRSVEFRDGATYLRKGFMTEGVVIVRPGERVKRPEPKVLDADGVEIRVGDTVYAIRYGHVKCTVLAVEFMTDGCLVEVENGIGHKFRQTPEDFTHRAPVLAADGRPLREGETVWHEDGTELKVLDFLHEEDDETIVKVERVSGPTNWSECRSLSLTHEHPEIDSWERLEKDAKACVCAYFGTSVKDCVNCDHFSWECSYDKAEDLVRRAKALAGDA